MVATGNRESRQSAPGRRKSQKSAAVQTMAKMRCPKRTSGVERSILVAATRRTLTADQTRARIMHAVEAVISTTTGWDTPADERTVGDHRFLILGFCPTKSASLYVQLWTEPGEPVLVEVCSGAWTPPARKYVRGPQRAALRLPECPEGLQQNCQAGLGERRSGDQFSRSDEPGQPHPAYRHN
jgi:hypothetical protein